MAWCSVKKERRDTFTLPLPLSLNRIPNDKYSFAFFFQFFFVSFLPFFIPSTFTFPSDTLKYSAYTLPAVGLNHFPFGAAMFISDKFQNKFISTNEDFLVELVRPSFLLHRLLLLKILCL
jgi:hypothetical protein